MVKVLYEERNSRLYGESSKYHGGKGDKPPKGNGWNGDKPPLSPPSSSSSSSLASSSSTTTTLSQTHPNFPRGLGKTPFIKLDIKYEFPMYDGEVIVESLDNWIRHIELYCRIQRIKDDEAKIQLDSLRLEGATLIWWEAKTQEDMKKPSKYLSS